MAAQPRRGEPPAWLQQSRRGDAGLLRAQRPGGDRPDGAGARAVQPAVQQCAAAAAATPGAAARGTEAPAAAATEDRPADARADLEAARGGQDRGAGGEDEGLLRLQAV